MQSNTWLQNQLQNLYSGSKSPEYSAIYSKHRLDPADHEIRLICLYPGTGSAPIVCELNKISLDDRPPYEALSYAWGTNHSGQRILLDGHEICIGSNLWDALRYLRDRYDPRWLWVDALSIDQANLQERSHQVQQMGSIYRSATRVLAWLGEASDDSDLALHTMLALSTDIHFKQSDIFFAPRWNGHAWQMQVAKRFKAVKKLMNRPWWLRIWCVQEIALCKEADIVCGRTTLPWSVFRSFADSFKKHLVCCSRKDLQASLGSTHENTIHNMYKLIDNRTRAIEKRSLLWATRSFSNGLCSDERDKVYGLLALAEVEMNLRPDYTLPVSDVYQQTTRAIIESEQNLDIFLYSTFKKQGPGLPSWVPDWRKDLRGHGTLLKSTLEYNSCGYMKPNPRLILGRSVLAIGAYHIDEIVLLSTSQVLLKSVKSIEKLAEAFNACFLEWERIAGTHHRSPVSSSATQNTIWGPAKVPKQRSHHHNATNPDSTRSDFFQKWHKWVTKAGGYTPDEFRNKNTAQALEHLLPFVTTRIFFRTRSGFIGLGPLQTLAGDKVAILAGGRTPFILRLNNKLFFDRDRPHVLHWLIGYAYVEGIMHGEAVGGNVAGGKGWDGVYLS
ncbi:hypothetical protein MMC26_003819 [Xylographa opegraphella]|nr:hypothetical protein [Xylographa opegraphella]